MKHCILAFVLFLEFKNLYSQSFNSFKDARDGRTYKTTIIGGQTWMAENLNADKFRNGDKIRKVLTPKEWLDACFRKEPVWMYYKNIAENGSKYGKIYNYYAVIDRRNLAPLDYHIPSESEFLFLAQFPSSNLKSVTDWFSSIYKKRVLENVDRIDRNGFPYVDLDFVEREFRAGGSGDNSTAFNALPSGSLDLFGNSQLLSKIAGFWTSTNGRVDGTQVAFKINWNEQYPSTSFVSGTEGFYIRCIAGKSQEEIEKIEEEKARVDVTLNLDKMNVLYIGIPNPITIGAMNYKVGKIKFSITGGDGTYVKKGLGKYDVYVKSETDDCAINIDNEGKISVFNFKVRKIPVAQAFLGDLSSGTIVKGDSFRSQSGLVAGIKNFPIELEYHVVSFIFTCDTKDDIISIMNQGAEFSPKVRLAINEHVQAGRMVTIDDILIKGPDGLINRAPSLLYYIK